MGGPEVLKKEHIDAVGEVEARTLQNSKVTGPKDARHELAVGSRCNFGFWSSIFFGSLLEASRIGLLGLKSVFLFNGKP
jgi:hypothetical protein